MQRPEPNEYDSYYGRYISLVEQDVLDVLATQPATLRNIFAELSEEISARSYAAGKWSIKEVIGHIIDGERMFAYRAFRISRGDVTPIEGFEQDGYIELGRAGRRSLADLLDEFELLRVANMLMFHNMDDDDWRRMGTASDCPVSVRALAYIIAGHVIHHTKILNERYLV